MADAGRVIAGTARGIRLAAPGPTTRPFGDRVKQTLFAVLDADLRDARVLDLFAGSGAGGIEALSRGARSATFVERDRAAADVIDDNLRRTHLDERATVVRSEALAWLAARATRNEPWDVVILDPPYADTDLLARTLEALGRPGVVAAGGRIVAKHFWRDTPATRIGLLASERERRFGETALTFYRVGSDEGASEEER